MTLQPLTLSTGALMPAIGLGTWFIDDDRAADAVRAAVDAGYRAIDTAQAYGNERGVGEGVRTASVPREELFVSTKLAAEIKTYEGAVASIDGSLERLGLDYVDLMLIHSPQPWSDFRGGDYSDGNREAWRALEDAFEAGKLRAIGVSNFLVPDLDAIAEGARVTPHVNQLLVHAGNTPVDLLDECARRGIVVQAYSPFGHGEVLSSPELAEVAASYDVSPARLCLRYAIQLGTQPLPKTENPEHMRANLDLDFEISDADMDRLKALDLKDYGAASIFPVYSGK